MDAAELACPECGTPYEQGDFQCPACELLLDVEAVEANYRPNDPSIVRALLSPPQRRNTGVRPVPPLVAGRKKEEAELTTRTTMVMDDGTIPHLVVGVDLALSPLHEFEALVASFVDGTNTVAQIAIAAEISRVEAMAVLSSLAQRRVVELYRSEIPAEVPIEMPTEGPTEPARRGDPITLPPTTREELARLDPSGAPIDDEPAPTQPVVIDDYEFTPAPPTLQDDQEEVDVDLEDDDEDEVVTRPPSYYPTPVRGLPAQPVPTDPSQRHRPPPRLTPAPRRLTPAPTPRLPYTPHPAAARMSPGSLPTRTGPPPEPPRTSRPRSSQLQTGRHPPERPRAESVLERAIALERRGEVDGAIHVLKKAITQVKEPAALCNKLALILVNQRKDFRQAEELLNKAMELEPDNAVYRQNLFKVVSMAAERRDDRGGKGSGKGGGFFSRLLKK